MVVVAAVLMKKSWISQKISDPILKANIDMRKYEVFMFVLLLPLLLLSLLLMMLKLLIDFSKIALLHINGF